MVFRQLNDKIRKNLFYKDEIMLSFPNLSYEITDNQHSSNFHELFKFER